MEVFGPEWAAAWRASINADAGYREAGRTWVGAVVLKVWADPSARTAGPALRDQLAAGAGASTGEAAPVSSSVEGHDRTVLRSVIADLAGGRCKEARVATPADEIHARIVVGAPVSTWAEVLAGELDPIMGLMRGRLKLERGSLVSLVPHARGARALLATAARLDAVMPASGLGAMVLEPGSAAVPPIDPPPADGAGWVRPPALAGVEEHPSLPESGAAGLSRSAEPPVGAGFDLSVHPPLGAGPDASADVLPAGAGPDAAPRAPTALRSLRSARTGLDHHAFPMRLWHKSKKLGVWDPRDISLEKDRQDWEALDELERDVLLRLAALFQAGEEAVTLDLLPLMGVVAAEGRLEEAMYLTSFLWEESKHVEAFRRFIDDVARHEGALDRYATPSYRTIFEEELPGSLHRLRADASPHAQGRAAVVYNMIVEGVLAETGYHGYQRILEDNGILPGMQETVRNVKRDESRHIAYGLYLLSRLVAENGDAVRVVIEDEMTRLLDPALEVITEVFQAYEVMPFGLELDVFTAFGLSQFQHRLGRLEKAWERGALLTEAAEWAEGRR